MLYIIENSVDISGNSIIDTILFAIIGGISFSIAFGLVGRIFDKLGVYDSDLMSDTHWLIRVIVFIVLTHVSIKVAQVIKWIFSFQWWRYPIAFLMLIGIVVLAYYVIHRISKKKI